MANNSSKPLVAIIMGSDSDWPTMRMAAETLEALGVAYEAKVVSAHRTPGLMNSFAAEAACLLYTSPSPRDLSTSRMPSSA